MTPILQRRSEKTAEHISLSGHWRLHNLSFVQDQLQLLTAPVTGRIVFNLQGLLSIDTSMAALLLDPFCERLKAGNVVFENMRPEHERIIALVSDHYKGQGAELRRRHQGLLVRIGRGACNAWSEMVQLLSFIGEIFLSSWKVIKNPRLLRWNELFVQLEVVLLDAVFIVFLVTFLIGVVVAYLSAVQIEKYGGHIFIVDALSLTMCRELSPILVAIVLAGRSGSAFAAQIGTMKLNEETDALRVLGLDANHVLVLPRLMALALAMPLLVFLGDAAGILGGMVIAEHRLGITGITFMQRLESVLHLRAVFFGLAKAPVFAIFIALIGCRMGLTVEDNARSVGLHTTSTVVQSIVSVILLNAAFAILASELGI